MADILRTEAETARNVRIDGIDGITDEMGVSGHGLLQDVIHDMRILL